MFCSTERTRLPEGVGPVLLFLLDRHFMTSALTSASTTTSKSFFGVTTLGWINLISIDRDMFSIIIYDSRVMILGSKTLEL